MPLMSFRAVPNVLICARKRQLVPYERPAVRRQAPAGQSFIGRKSGVKANHPAAGNHAGPGHRDLDAA